MDSADARTAAVVPMHTIFERTTPAEVRTNFNEVLGGISITVENLMSTMLEGKYTSKAHIGEYHAYYARKQKKIKSTVTAWTTATSTMEVLALISYENKERKDTVEIINGSLRKAKLNTIPK